MNDWMKSDDHQTYRLRHECLSCHYGLHQPVDSGILTAVAAYDRHCPGSQALLSTPTWTVLWHMTHSIHCINLHRLDVCHTHIHSLFLDQELIARSCRLGITGWPSVDLEWWAFCRGDTWVLSTIKPVGSDIDAHDRILQPQADPQSAATCQ